MLHGAVAACTVNGDDAARLTVGAADAGAAKRLGVAAAGVVLVDVVAAGDASDPVGLPVPRAVV